jgi:small subunit ribosomal protein S5
MADFNNKFNETEENALIEHVVGIRRVAKTTKGGRNMSFATLIIVGDGNGKVGVGYAKAREIPAATSKAKKIAIKNMFQAPKIGGTIPHPVQGEKAAGVVFLRPASPGTGVIAGGPVRAVLECAGYTDVLTKSLGSSNSINIVGATIAALKLLKNPEDVAARRGLALEDVVPARLLSNIAKFAKLDNSNSEEVKADTKDAPAEKKAPAKKAPAKKAAPKAAPKAEKADDVKEEKKEEGDK